MPFEERSRRLRRGFKWGIILLTLAVAAVAVGLAPTARHKIVSFAQTARDVAIRNLVGLEPTREELDARLESQRAETERQTRASVRRYYDKTSPEIRHLFDVAKMNPETCVIGVGRASDGFLLSSAVFDPDPLRGYRLKPDVDSVWLRQITLIDGPFGLFLVPDTPEVREAAAAAGAIVDEPSKQHTNSWGLRGPEPDPSAEARGIVLGDSFMQGMFNGDDSTPPVDLEKALEATWGVDVSLVNTGHIGYSPQQYCRSLEEYGPKIDPQFVVLSVCPNDFGNGDAVMAGGGDNWDEAAYWIERINQWCRARSIPCLLVVVPTDRQILTVRKEGFYPGLLSNMLAYASSAYLYPFERFLDEHLELARGGESVGYTPGQSLLFNNHIADNHFSPLGSKLWAELVAHRLDLILRDRPGGAKPEEAAE